MRIALVLAGFTLFVACSHADSPEVARTGMATVTAAPIAAKTDTVAVERATFYAQCLATAIPTPSTTLGYVLDIGELTVSETKYGWIMIESPPMPLRDARFYLHQARTQFSNPDSASGGGMSRECMKSWKAARERTIVTIVMKVVGGGFFVDGYRALRPREQFMMEAPLEHFADMVAARREAVHRASVDVGGGKLGALEAYSPWSDAVRSL
jgi:hypothetical protein